MTEVCSMSMELVVFFIVVAPQFLGYWVACKYLL